MVTDENESSKMFFTSKFFKFTIGYIVIAITLLFLSNLCFENVITLEIMNNWISLILGLVATILSILSMGLSFYSYEMNRDIAQENTRTMNSLKEDILNEVREVNKEHINKLHTMDNRLLGLEKDVKNIHDTVADRVVKPEEKIVQNDFDL